jgi:hypothetical protein
MAKRFTDTNKYKKPFIRSLPGVYKLFWDYLYHDCDHAGVWIVDFDIAQVYLGTDMPINKTEALKYFNADGKRIIECDNGCRWFIPSFIEIQYGELNEENKAHNSVINILKKYKLYNNKPLKNPLLRAKEGAMDMDKDKDMVKDMEILPDFFATFLTWLRYKRRRGESYKDKDSTLLAYKKLVKLSDNNSVKAIEIVEQSMAQNWAGLFELKQEFKKSNPNDPDEFLKQLKEIEARNGNQK